MNRLEPSRRVPDESEVEQSYSTATGHPPISLPRPSQGRVPTTAAAPSGDPDPGDDPSDDEDPFGGGRSPPGSGPGRDPDRPRRDSIERMAQTVGESDLAQMWSRDGRLATPRTNPTLK